MWDKQQTTREERATQLLISGTLSIAVCTKFCTKNMCRNPFNNLYKICTILFFKNLYKICTKMHACTSCFGHWLIRLLSSKIHFCHQRTVGKSLCRTFLQAKKMHVKNPGQLVICKHSCYVEQSIVVTEYTEEMQVVKNLNCIDANNYSLELGEKEHAISTSVKWSWLG